MSYDLIETFVKVQIKEISSAKYVQHVGQVQFEQVLPLEAEPKTSTLIHYMKQYFRCTNQIADAFIRAGYFLNLIKREELYRYAQDEGLQGYTSFYKFCETCLGTPKTTAIRLMAINTRFCNNQPVLPETYQRFTASKLGIMAMFQNGLEGKLTPEVTCEQLNKLSKYYALKDWEVDLKTTWREDLSAYEEYVKEQRFYRKRYLNKKFTSVTDELPAEEPKEKKSPGLISKKYDAYIKFCERMKDQISALRKISGYTVGLAELEAQIDRMMKAAETAQMDDIFDAETEA